MNFDIVVVLTHRLYNTYDYNTYDLRNIEIATYYINVVTCNFHAIFFLILKLLGLFLKKYIIFLCDPSTTLYVWNKTLFEIYIEIYIYMKYILQIDVRNWLQD